MHTLQSAAQVLDYINSIISICAYSNPICLWDIDDTIIVPKSLTFQAHKYRDMISDIKQNKHLHPNYELIISTFRKNREVMLVDDSWPTVLSALRAKITSYGLTKIDSGRFGIIDSVEKWRYEELKAHGIEFDPQLQNVTNTQNMPSLYNGIFFTGTYSKGKTLEYFAKHFTTCDLLIAVDDKEENLWEISEFCTTRGINCSTILFNAIELLAQSTQINEQAFQIQRNMLVENLRWIEYNEALDILRKTQIHSA